MRGDPARTGPLLPAMTMPCSLRVSGNRFIGGVPMKRAANSVAGRA
jgi:hypothetical protein